MKREDVDYAVAILRKYRTAAMAKENQKARKEVEHVMKVLDALYVDKK